MTRPPRLWARIAGLAASGADRDSLLEDLDQEFCERSRQSVRGARRWYRRQVLRSMLPLLDARLRGAAGQSLLAGGAASLRVDVQQAVRSILRRPAVPAAVAASLAVAVALFAAVASVADASLRRALPFPGGDRILTLTTVHERGQSQSVNFADLSDIASTARSLSAVSPYEISGLTWQTDEGTARVMAARVGARFFDVLGSRPALGRTFDASEFDAATSDVVVVTGKFFRGALGSSLSDAVVLNGRRHRIVGVLPETPFEFPLETDLYLPLVLPADSWVRGRSALNLSATARVCDRCEMAAARAEIGAMSDALRAAHPSTSGKRRIDAMPLHDVLGRQARPTLLLLLATVVAALLIAGANVAALMLSRAAERGREFAVRLSLGAGRVQLARQLMAEAAILGVAGSAFGLAAAPLLSRALIETYPGTLPRAAEIGMTPGVAATASALAILAAVAASIPAIRMARRASVHAMFGARITGDRALGRLTRTVAAVQFALSLVLMTVTILFARSLMATSRIDAGFDSRNLLTFNLSASGVGYPNAAAVNQFFDTLISDLGRLPGVTAVAAAGFIPLTPGNWTDGFARGGRGDARPNLPEADAHFVSPAFVRAMGMQLVEGRELQSADTASAPRVVMVNRTLAEKYFDRRAVGQTLTWQGEARTIVGVLSDKRHRDLFAAPAPEIYLPLAQMPRQSAWILVRSSSDPAPLLPSIRGVVRKANPAVPMTQVARMEDRVAEALAGHRFRAFVSATVAAAALLLAAAGLYGVVARSVAARTREIGIRAALGESPLRVRVSMLRSSLVIAACGSAGGAFAILASRAWIAGRLDNSADLDIAATVASVTMLLLTVSIAAAWLPARRASRVDPTIALRAD